MDDNSKYDQFKGKKSTYKETLYTTELDTDKITPQMQKYAVRIENEILEADSRGNVHMAEER